MTEFLKRVLAAQFDAALAMMRQCIVACRDEHWEGKIANGTFRQWAYHTLFFVDYYLSPGETTFALRELHRRGGDELQPGPCVGLSREETLAYLAICRAKLHAALDAESDATLAGPCNFERRNFSRAELYLYNLRHVQHHTGQFSAYLRRVDDALKAHRALPWIGSEWRE